jgi:diguanylate cyclase (GGDEF)-like protein/PAS domain S-box-containing protein
MKVSFFPWRGRSARARMAARALFYGAGPLSRARGPAAIVEGDGAVIVANAGAWRCAELLGLAGAAPLRSEIATAIASGRPATIPLAGAEGGFIVDILPLGLGTALLIGHDGGATGALNQALVESRARYKSLVELSSEFAWETDSDGRFIFVSPAGALGWTADELVGRPAADFLSLPIQPSPFAAREAVGEATLWWRCKDGGAACLSVAAMPVERHGRWHGARGMCRDVTAERAQEDAIARVGQRENLLAHLVRLLRDAEDAETMLAGACETAARALGARAARIDGVDADGATAKLAAFGPAHEDAALALMIARAARSDGGIATMDSGAGRRIARATTHRHGVNGVLLLERAADAAPWSEEDRLLVTGIADQLGIALAQAAAQAALAEASRTDPLTGLLNRRAFADEMAQRLARAPGLGSPGALLAVDLDNFKAVNDGHGHERGDAALKAVAALLAARTRPGDLVARLGGDEFAIWLERIDDASASARARELIAAAADLARFSGGAAPPLGFSIGVAMRRGEGELASLLARADAAMYAVKRRGKGGYQLDGEQPLLAVAEHRKAARG